MAFAATSLGYGERTPTTRGIEGKGKRRTEGAVRRLRDADGEWWGLGGLPVRSTNADVAS